MERDLLEEAYSAMSAPKKEAVEPTPGSGTDVAAVQQTATPIPEVAPVAENSAFDIIIDNSDLGDFLQVSKEYFKSLTPEQQTAMITYFQDRLTPQEESLGIQSQAGMPLTTGMAIGMGQQMGMSNKAKILGIPPGQSARSYGLNVGGTYKIVDRTAETITVSGDDGKKYTFPKHLVQLV